MICYQSVSCANLQSSTNHHLSGIRLPGMQARSQKNNLYVTCCKYIYIYIYIRVCVCSWYIFHRVPNLKQVYHPKHYRPSPRFTAFHCHKATISHNWNWSSTQRGTKTNPKPPSSEKNRNLTNMAMENKMKSSGLDLLLNVIHLQLILVRCIKFWFMFDLLMYFSTLDKQIYIYICILNIDTNNLK